MIVVKLQEAVLAYKRRTGKRMNYKILAERIGVERDVLSAIATKPGYNTTLEKIDAICDGLGVAVGDLLERRPGPQRIVVERKHGIRSKAHGSRKTET